MSRRVHCRTRSIVRVSTLTVAFALALLLVPALSLVPSVAHAVPARELIARSRAATSRGEWNAAARALEELTAAGIDSSDICYDLGTVYAHAGRHGEAIYQFERVARRSPLAFDAQHNLRATRLLLAHRDAGRTGRAVVESPLPLRVAIGEALPPAWALGLCLVCQLLALSGVVLNRRKHGGELARVAGASAAVLFTVGALGTMGILAARAMSHPSGVVLHEGVRLLRSPASDAIEGPAVREGERLEVLDAQGTFVRVKTAEGQTAWLPRRDVGALE